MLSVMKSWRRLPLWLCLLTVACAPAAAPPAAPKAAGPGATAPPATSAPAAAAAAASASPAAAATPAATASGPLRPPVMVKMGVIGIAPEAGIYIALDRGYFAQEGLELELVPARTMGEQTPLLATGELHFGGGGPDPSLFNAALRDIPIKIVGHQALVTPTDASAALIVRKDLVDSGRVRELSDLRGLTIAINVPRTTSQLYVERILARGGLTLQDATLTLVPFADMLPALGNRAADAAWQIEPLVTVADAQNIAKSAIAMADVYPGAYTQILLLSPVFAQEQPEAARRFVAAHLRGLRDYYRAVVQQAGGKEEIFELLTKYTAVKDAGLYARIGWHGVDPNGALDERVLDDMQDYFLANGSQQQKVDLSRIVDRTYLRYALERLGPQP